MKSNIQKVIKTLYAMVDQYREALEEEAAMIQGEPEANDIVDGYTYEEIIGYQLLANLALQDAMLRWINVNNLDALTVQQRKDLFGLMQSMMPVDEVH